MKVIGHTSSHGVLLEATPQELAHIQGFQYVHELPNWQRVENYQRERPAYCFRVNDTIPISVLWEIIRHERSRPAEIATAVRNLRSLADLLENVNKMLPTPLQPASEEKP